VGQSDKVEPIFEEMDDAFADWLRRTSRDGTGFNEKELDAFQSGFLAARGLIDTTKPISIEWMATLCSRPDEQAQIEQRLDDHRKRVQGSVDRMAAQHREVMRQLEE
jgi:hypothetical protein